MFTLTVLLILAVMVALFGCLMGLFSIIGLFFSLLTGILVGALAAVPLPSPSADVSSSPGRRQNDPHQLPLYPLGE